MAKYGKSNIFSIKHGAGWVGIVSETWLHQWFGATYVVTSVLCSYVSNLTTQFADRTSIKAIRSTSHSVRLVVGRPEFDSVIESYQRLKKLIFTTAFLHA